MRSACPIIITVLLIAANSMAMMVRDRVTEVAVMRALGFERFHVVALLLVEASLIGLTGTSPVEAFLPVMLFAILFGLSMDYQVFLVSRMHEEYIKSGGDNRIAVRNGPITGMSTASRPPSTPGSKVLLEITAS